MAGAAMNTATIRRNGHAPSEATIAACKALLGSAIKGDADAAREIAAIPSQAWPDKTMREAARHIIELTADGAALELPILLHRLAVGGKVSTGDVSALTKASPVYDTEAVGDIIRTTTESAKGGIWRTCGPRALFRIRTFGKHSRNWTHTKRPARLRRYPRLIRRNGSPGNHGLLSTYTTGLSRGVRLSCLRVRVE